MSRYLSNSIYTILNKIVNVGITFVVLVFIARGLGPDGQGEYSLLVQLSRTFFYFFTFGIPNGMVFYFGRNEDKRPEVIKTYFYIYLIITLLAILASILFGHFGFEEFFSGITYVEVFIALLGVPLWFANSYLGAIYRGLENFKRLNLNSMAQPVVMLLGILILFLLEKLTVRNAVWVYLAGLLANLILNVAYITEGSFRLNFFRSKFDRNIVKVGILYSFKSYVGSIAEFLIYKADIYIIAFYLSKAELGLYVIAVNLVERLWMFSEPISNVLFSKLVNTRDEEKKNFFTIYTLQGTFLISMIGAIGLYIVSDLFIELFFGSEYNLSTNYLYILIPGVVFQSISLIMKKILEARGYPGSNALSSILCLFINVGLNVWLIPKIGVTGAAISTTIAYTAYFLFLSHSLKQKFGIKRRKYIIFTFNEAKYLVNDLLLKQFLVKNK